MDGTIPNELEPLRTPARELAPAPTVADTLHRIDGHFQRLLEKLPAGAYMCDPDGLITYYNQRAVALWGRAPALKDPVDRWCGSFKLYAADGSPIAHDRCWMALALQQDREFNGHEIIIERPDGERVTALAHANPIRDASGKLLGAVNVLVDITDRKLAESALRDADVAKNEFLAMLAHELRNPLAPIRHALEVLHLRGLPNELKGAVEIIDRQVKHMTRLVDDLLDVARITGNKIELRVATLDLVRVVAAAVETSRPIISARKHALSIDLPNEEVWIDGDQARLGQVIANLLNNAAKFTPSGGRIWLRMERQGNDAVISIADTGMGIAADVLPHVFDMFTQAPVAIHTPRDGLGVGLTLVRRLVELHRGSVTANSKGLGHGSEFVVRLPLAQSATRGAEPPLARHGYPSLSLRILVADDNSDAAESLTLLLRILGADVSVANDGDEALRIAETFLPQAMILDIGMPKVNGYDVARQVRGTRWGNRIALIAVTGWGQDADRQRGKEAGFDYHFVKPVDANELIDVLGTLNVALESAVSAA